MQEFRGLPRATALTLCALAGVTVALFAAVHTAKFSAYDFVAFRCGAAAIVAHANPYVNQPLHSCEVRSSPEFFTAYPNVTIPAPLPPYALAAFVPFTPLPFAVARALWWAILSLCALWIGDGVSRLTGMTVLSASVTCAFAVLAPALVEGALAPLAIGCIVWAALALRERRWNRAAVLLCAAMIEPHMSLPACAAAALFVPAMRLRLAAGAALAAAVCIAAVGPDVSLAYFTQVLPAHAASEVNNLAQESLTALLYHAGIAPPAALFAGALQYVVLISCGVLLAARQSVRESDAAWLALLPAAFAVIGGQFIHATELAMVLPLACLLAARSPSLLSYGVLVAVAVPLDEVVNWPLLASAAAIVLAWLLAVKRVPSFAIVLASTSLIAIAVLGNALAQNGIHPAALAIADPGPAALASVTWQQFNAALAPSVLWWPGKIVTVLPLILLVYLAFSAGGAQASVRPFRYVRA